MKLFIHFIIVCISTCLPSLCMDTCKTKIITSDNKEITLPQSKIEQLRLLHRKQQLQIVKEKYYQTAPAPIVLKTICSKKLRLVSDALDTQDFSAYFKSLGTQDLQPEAKLNISKDQRLLICAAGQQELDVPSITQRLAKTCFCQDLFECLNSHVSVTKAIDYLQYAITFENIKQSNFTQETSNYCEKGKNCIIPMGTEYIRLPKLLENQTNFSGRSQMISIEMGLFSQETNSSDKKWWLDNYVKNHNLDMYFLTAIEPDSNSEEQEPDNKKKLWAFLHQENKLLTKVITHNKSSITLNAFSKNGKYLATSSEGPHSELVLTDLTIKNGDFLFPDLFLTGINGTIDQICFNSKSTVLAALSEKKIYFYDVKTNNLLAILDYPLQDDDFIEFVFNNNDSQLVITSWNNATLTSNIMLWDITNINHITLVKKTELDSFIITKAYFTPSDNKLIIETTQNALLLHGKTGNILMNTARLQDSNHRGWVHAVLMQNEVILVTLNHPADSDEYSIKLWDIMSNQLITTIEQKNGFENIGITADGRSIIAATVLSGEMIKIDLYNDATANSLDWSHHKMDLFKKYLLLRLWRASKLNDSVSLDPDCFESQILQDLPLDFKTLVEKYLRRSI